MKSLKQSILLTLLCFLIITSCSKDHSDGEAFTPQKYNVSGKVEKGPFISGSTISIQPMDGKLQVLGSMFNTTITDNLGDFTFGSKEFQAPYAEMMASGYFFNEIRGRLSDGVLVLRSLVDLSDNTTTNVNILTHLKYSRIKKLIESGKSFKEANLQAQKELLSAFGLENYASKDVSQFSIISGTDESAALIAVSSLLLVNRSEAELTEYLSALSQEFGANGSFSEITKNQFKQDRLALANQLSNIQDNVVKRYSDLGMNVEVKNLIGYFDWDDDGIAGNEVLKEGESVTLSKNKISVPVQGGTYSIEINSPIPVYIISPIQNSANIPYSNDAFTSLYEGDTSIVNPITTSLENNILTIKVGKSQSRTECISTINLYDCMNNVVASVKLTIEGDESAKLPLLGSDLQNAINYTAAYLSDAYSNYNILEQYYYYNKDINKLPISSSDNYLSNTWNNFFKANGTLLLFKEAEAQRLNLYEDYFNVFYAMYYYSMISVWGDIPYNYGKRWDIADYSIPRIDKNTILADLKPKLTTAIENLEEKKNQSLIDANGFFFVSKDVARILLANIYMYEKNWSAAKTLLAKVRSNGYYELDSSSEYDKASNGIIFAFFKDQETRSTVNIKTPALIPIQSITDVYLSSAECEYHLGNTSEAQSLLKKVTSAKGITVSDDVFIGIKEARAKELLYNAGYLAFLKRNDLAISDCGIQSYQLLFPIPQQELLVNPNLSQNSGY